MAWTWADVENVYTERKEAAKQMRRAGRVDENQPRIVKAFRAVGATVEILSSVGGGVPDTLIGFRGINGLFEIKDPNGRGLNATQRIWHANWAGQVSIAESVEDAVKQLISLVSQQR
jgi:hypothetical protein